MGATATMAVTSRVEVKNKIPCIILWVPDPESTFDKDPNKINEEEGQKYKESFWKEAYETNFIKNLKEYTGVFIWFTGRTTNTSVKNLETKQSNACRKKIKM